jgi:hypothetical protein
MKFRQHLYLMLLLSSSSFACDLCGGVGANASIGLLAGTRFHTIGYQTNYRQFNSYIDHIAHAKGLQVTQEFSFRWQALQRFQVYGYVPYVQNTYKETFDSISQKGWGDLRAFANSIIFHRQDSSGRSLSYVSLGYGIKFSTGKFAPVSSAYTNLYPGTGSTDHLFLLNAFKRLYSQLGIQAEASYSLKSTNSNGYKYGNSSQCSILLILNQQLGQYRLIAHSGLEGNLFAASRQSGVLLASGQNNAGYTLTSKLGCMLLTRHYLVATSFQLPIAQDLNMGQTKLRWAANLQFQFFIQKKSKQ